MTGSGRAVVAAALLAARASSADPAPASPATVPSAPASATVAEAAVPGGAPVAATDGAVSATIPAGALPSSTMLSSPPISATVAQQAAMSSTVQVAPRQPPRQATPPPGHPGLSRTAAGGPAPVPYEELHRRASLIMFPTAYAAHFKGPTGENAEVFLLWYIGTLYDERGLSIAPISTLFIGADLKWSFLSEKGLRPAAALGYVGGLQVPFTGGVIKTSGLAEQKDIKQSFVHDAYMVLSRSFGPLALTGGAMRGIKKAFPVILPMLRNPNFSTKPNPAPEVLWAAFAGADLAVFGRHFKFEVMTLPEVEIDRPWLVNTHLGGILGFDFAYLRDRIGWELLGYYQLPFYRWPDQKRMEKERDRLEAARKRR